MLTTSEIGVIGETRSVVVSSVLNCYPICPSGSLSFTPDPTLCRTGIIVTTDLLLDLKSGSRNKGRITELSKLSSYITSSSTPDLDNV